MTAPNNLPVAAEAAMETDAAITVADEAEADDAEVTANLLDELTRLRETVASLQASVSALDKQWGRVGREQFKANTLTETQQQQAQAALDQLRELNARRESEMMLLREQLSATQTAQRLNVIERLLPMLDGLDEALAAGLRLQARAPQNTPTTPPPNATPPVLTLGQRLSIALGRANLAEFLPRPAPVELPTLTEWRTAVTAWLQGLTFVRERLLQVLASEGVYPLATIGEAFDPHQHIAIETTAATVEIAAGEIVAEYRRGYRHGERVLRPAEVVVAR